MSSCSAGGEGEASWLVAKVHSLAELQESLRP